MEAVFEHQGGIDADEIRRVREMIGKPLRIDQYNHEASYDTIRHYALGLGDDYYRELASDLGARRDLLSAGLADAGFTVFPTAGTYFVTADITPFGETDGMEFCRALPERCGVVAIPNVVFYDNVAAGRSLVRFTFCKQRDVREEAVRRLAKLAG